MLLPYFYKNACSNEIVAITPKSSIYKLGTKGEKKNWAFNLSRLNFCVEKCKSSFFQIANLREFEYFNDFGQIANFDQKKIKVIFVSIVRVPDQKFYGPWKLYFLIGLSGEQIVLKLK